MTAGDFVGRVAELADLGAVLARGREGRGGLAIVVGEPGIGKTALVAAAADAAGVSVLWARAREGAGAPPLWMWDQVVRAARSRGWLEPGALGAVAGGADPALAGTGFDRFRRFDELTTVLTDLARREPFAIVLDDLQWADADSLALLEFLAPDLAGVPLVVLATARRGEMEAMPRADLVVELRGLRTAELGVLLRGYAGAAVSEELVTAVQRHTGGSPFFVGEVARLLRASGHAGDAAHWRGVVPEGVRAVLARRVARLPQLAHDALGAAAVLGFEQDATVLAAVLDVDRADVYDRLEPAVHTGLMQNLGDGRFAFAHALVHEAVASSVGTGRRRALHERAANVLEATRGARAAPEIASHRLAAGDGPGAASWSERAGDLAYRGAMYAEAAEWFARALAASPSPTAGLRVRHGDALSRSGDVAEANAAYAQAAREARESGDTDALARAALGTGTIGGGFEVRLLDAAQLGLLEDALARTEGSDTALRAVLMARLSVASTLHADHTARAALATDAVGMARRLGDDGALAYALSAWCDAHAGPAHMSERLAASAEMLTAARRSGDPELELLARRFAIVAQMESGNVPAATREIEAFARLADSLRQPQFCWYARLVEGMLAMLHGDLDEAERLATVASVLGREAHSANAQMLADGALLPMISRERGDPGFLARIEEMNLDQPEASRAADIIPLFGVGYGVAPQVARRALDAARALAMMPDVDDGLYVQATTVLGDAGAYVGDQRVMDEAAAALTPYADRIVLDGTAAVCYGPVSATLGRIAAARGDHRAAGAWFDRALAWLRSVHAPLLQARVERDAAAVSEVRGAAPPAPAERAAFVREGDVWLVQFAGAGARLRHSKGMSDLATLLARPGREVHVLDLVAAAEGRAAGSAPATGGDLGAALDAKARAAYEQRIRDLTEEIEEAESHHDDERAAKLDDERAVLLTELAGALGLSGRDRPQGSDAERARKAVGMRLRDTIARIERDLPALGRHLRHSVQTGTFCAYRPEHPVSWHCQA